MKKLFERAKRFFLKMKWKAKLYFARTIYVSFGENCLTDNILERHNLKLLTTPYSHGRTNIEYILQLEEDGYKDFLNLQHLRYEPLNNQKVPRLKKYNTLRNRYHNSQENGFEFTHHDVIGNKAVRQKFYKRVEKMLGYKGKKRFVIFYHHRQNPLTNTELLIEDLAKLKEIYSAPGLPAEVICFTQRIVDHPDQRKVELETKAGVRLFTLNTLKEWEGDNDDVFWARCDEDLVTHMIDQVKRL